MARQRKPQFKGGNYFRHQEADGDSKGYILGTRKDMVRDIVTTIKLQLYETLVFFTILKPGQ